MQVLVIGATGFLGYHTTLKLLARGHQVSALAQPPLPAENLLPAEVKITLTDLEALPDSELLAHLQGQDGLVFAAGVDDRLTPARPAYPFFYKGNVAATERLVRLAFLDPDYSARALGYAHLDLELDFVKTVQASLPAGRN